MAILVIHNIYKYKKLVHSILSFYFLLILSTRVDH